MQTTRQYTLSLDSQETVEQEYDSLQTGETRDTQVSSFPSPLSSKHSLHTSTDKVMCPCCVEVMCADHTCANEMDNVDSITPPETVEIASLPRSPVPPKPPEMTQESADAIVAAVTTEMGLFMRKRDESCKTQ